MNMKFANRLAVTCATALCFNVALHAQPAPEATTAAPPRKTPDVVYVPTPYSTVDRMLELADVKPGDVVYDLGCGDGRIVVAAAKKYGVKAVGFDIDPERVKESLENVRTNNVGHLVTIKQEDIFTLDLSQANVVTLYLLPSLNVKLIPQLEKMKPGSRIVSQSFDMQGVTPEITTNDNGRTIYKWVTPLKKESTTTAVRASAQ
jgi:SAM-dependent methyltransferase